MPSPWIDRRFTFGHPIEYLPVLRSRLRGAATRVAAAVRGLPAALLTQRPAGEGDAEAKWSVQEHVGHLVDLEALHSRRLEELARGAPTLSAADMDNRATWQANHNARPFAAVLADLSASRAAFLARLAALSPTQLAVQALHPRLQQPMRAVDVAYFVAEHDDHHLTRIEEMVGAAGTPPPAPAFVAAWHELPLDAPMPTLERRRIVGTEAMISHITLHAGCEVPVHAHANEQFSVVLSGRVRFALHGEERVLGAGEVLHLPSHAPHGAQALEHSVVLDVFAPPSATTGIDRR